MKDDPVAAAGRREHPLLRRTVPAALLVGALVAGLWFDGRRDMSGPDSPPEASWLGNSAAGGPPGGGPGWVQQDVEGIAVSRDGTVYATSRYDEGGREVGVYKDGEVVGGLADTHGFGRLGGSAVAVEGDELIVAVSQTDEFSEEAPLDGVAYYVRTFDAAEHTPVPVPGGSGDDGSQQLVSTSGPVTGLAMTPDEIVVSVAAEGLVQIVDRRTRQVRRTLAVEEPSDVAADQDGGFWVISGHEVRRYDREGASDVVVSAAEPTAIALDGAGRLFVASDATQQVSVFDVTAEPKLTGTIGEPGGMLSAPVGRVGPLRFDGIVGVGVDDDGAVYVASGLGGTGTDIRRLVLTDGEWQEEWQLLALAFVDMADIDPEDGTTVYTARDRYDLDLDRPVGQQWRWAAHTVDRKRYPDDPRLLDTHQHVTPDIVRLRGRLLMFATGMYQKEPRFYRFEDETAVASTAFPTGGWGWQVDAYGDVWNVEGQTLRRYRLTGFSTAGDPEYGPPEETEAPKVFTEVLRVHYDTEDDVMYLSGWTRENPKPEGNDLEKLIGSEVVRYDSWSTGAPQERWRTVVPFERLGDDLRDLQTPVGLSVAGDRFYTVDKGTSRVREYSTEDGREVRTWLPGDTVGSYVGVVDVPDGIRATVLDGDRFLLFVEEDHAAKVLLYDIRE